MPQYHMPGVLLVLMAPILFLLSCTSEQPDRISRQPTIQMSSRDTSMIFAPDLISTPGNERDMAISPEGKEIMYTHAMPDNSFRAIIRLRMDGDRVLRQEIAPFSGQHTDIEPFYSPDGHRLFFASTRPLHETDSTADYNIWFVEKKNGDWDSIATPMDTLINTDQDEYYPSLSTNGNLYFTASYPDTKGLEDIYAARYENGAYMSPVSLDSAINTKRYEFNAWVSPDEDLLIFSSYGRPDGQGGGDLYYSRRNPHGPWMPARNMGTIVNSPQLDYCPFVDEKNNRFYFTSNRRPDLKGVKDLTRFKGFTEGLHNGLGNIYVVNASAVLKE